jgi:hypothetical protein
MTKAYSSNQALISALNYSNLKNGEVIIKLNGEIVTGSLVAITMKMTEGHYTTFEIEGIIHQ